METGQGWLIFMPQTNFKKKKARIPAVTFFKQEKAPPLEPLRGQGISLSCEPLNIPEGYGDHKIVIQVRDPWTLYSYWELDPDRVEKKEKQLTKRGLVITKRVLRIQEGSHYPTLIRQDVELTEKSSQIYLQVEHDRSYSIDIGMVCDDTLFYPLAKSNQVRTPHFGMSPVIDRELKCQGEEYWRFFALSGGFAVGTSSMESKEIFLQRMTQWLTPNDNFLTVAR